MNSKTLVMDAIQLEKLLSLCKPKKEEWIDVEVDDLDVIDEKFLEDLDSFDLELLDLEHNFQINEEEQWIEKVKQKAISNISKGIVPFIDIDWSSYNDEFGIR